MKKRVFSIICALLIVATMFSIAITSVFGESTPEYDDVTEFSASGFNSTAWTGDTSNIAGSGALISAADTTTKTLTTVESYNLGTLWASSFITGNNTGDRNGNAFTLKIGELEAVLYEENTATGDGMAVGLIKDGSLVNKVAIGTRVTAKYLVLRYDNGTATVEYNSITYITENVGDMDFSDVKVTVSVEGNGKSAAIAINKFTLKHMLVEESSEPVSSEPVSSEPVSSEPVSSEPVSSEPVSSEPVSSEPVSSEPVSSEPVSSEPDSSAPQPEYDDVTEFSASGFNSADWTGDTLNIAGSGALISAADTTTKKLTTIKSYNLGTLWASSFIVGNNKYARNGNAFTLKIGELEAVLYEENTATGDGMAVELKKNGASVNRVAIGERITAKYLVLRYDNGTATVEYNSITYITEDVSDMDFSNVKATVSITGNGTATAIAVNRFTLKHMQTPETVEHLSGISISLGEDISAHFYAKDVDESATVNFTMNDVTKAGVVGTDNGDGTYEFIYTGVAPQCLGDTVKAELIINNTVVETKEYSLVEYLTALKLKSATELGYTAEKHAAMLTLIDDLLCYGGAAQEYKEHNTSSLVSAGVTGSNFESLTATDFNGDNSTDITWKSGNLVFDNVNKIKIKFECANPSNYIFKYSINGGEAVNAAYVSSGNGTYTITTDAISALSFDDVYRFGAYDAEGNEVAWLTYSVKSYVYSKQGKNNALAKLVQRTYMYGVSAKAFAAL